MSFSTVSALSPPSPLAVPSTQHSAAGATVTVAAHKRAVSETNTVADGGNSNGKRVKVVTQACKDCRRNKAKCDGQRPKCTPCVNKGRDCGYEGEVGQSRQAAMKARLEQLERLFDNLQNQAPEEAERLFRRIRGKDGVPGAVRRLDSSGEVVPRKRTSTSPESQSSSSGFGFEQRPVCGRDCRHQGHQGYGGSSSPGQFLPTLSASGSTLSSTSTSSSSMSSRGVVNERAPTLLVRLDLPDRAVTTRAVESFYSCTGPLFHVFTQEQISTHLNDIYESDYRHVSSSLKKAVCCVAIVASIGVQYSPDEFERGLDESLYGVARHYFVDVLEDRPLDAIKVCTLLAMYNIMNKATVSVGYVEVALGMSKRHSLNEKYYVYPGLTSDEFKESRMTWRCLIFFSTWLSSTLGYISSEDIPISALLPFAEAESDTSADIIDTVQVEMTKISILKADILRMHLAFKDLSEVAIKHIMADLQSFYHRLPPAMSLATLGESDLPDSVRRGIYYVHLLYLGALMLLYRRVASQFNRTSGTDDVRKRFELVMLNHAEQGVLAAKTSSRILGLLLQQLGCFKRCWVIIFQAYTSCVVLLHCVAQKQVHAMPPSSWDEDLPQIKTCLNTLEYCGTLDPVALSFHERLLPIYQSLREHIPAHAPLPPTPSSSGGQYDPVHSPHPFVYLLTVPATGNAESLALAKGLLRRLSRPYGNPSDGESVRDGYGLDTSRFGWKGKRELEEKEREGVEWDLRRVREYSWDVRKLGIPVGVIGGEEGMRGEEEGKETLGAGMAMGRGMKGGIGGGRWLGSEVPSGWTVGM